LVLLVTVLAVLVTGFTLSRASASYTTEASILVSPLPEGSSGFVGIGTVVDTGDPARTVQTAAALIDTPNAAAVTAQKLGRPWTTDGVMNAVNVEPRGASDVLAVSGTAATAAQAQRVANSFAVNSVRYRATVVQAQIGASIKALEARLTQLRTSSANAAETSALATAVEQLRAVQGTGNEPTMSVSQTAQLPSSPNGASKPLVLLLALLGGFALGSVAAVGLETFSRPVRDREEIQSLYPIPILAALPPVGTRRRSSRGTAPWVLPAAAFEQLRMLRVQISLSTLGPVIMVTSAGAGDGKTTVAAALAAAFAEADQSVIMLDLDLRKPDLSKLLEVEQATSGRSPLGVPLPVPKLPGVQVFPIPRGDMATVEALVQRLPLLIAQARRTADYVIVDTAPVGEVSEALRVATICDQIVFVARPRQTDRRRLIMARDLLDRAGFSPVGMVLVGKETGLPKGDQGYGYAMTPMGTSNGAHRDEPAERVPQEKGNGDAGVGVD
jgi:Mrp family chromosome partitioning ATPase